MRIILTAIDEPLAQAWQAFCGDLDAVSIHHGSILDLDCDAIVSPANSFGFMDGGIDDLYLTRFGRDLQTRLQRLILDRHHGELLVGAAEIVETGDRCIPYLIAAPTMRVPMILGDSINAYLAACAVLLLVKFGTFPSGPLQGAPIAMHVHTAAFPGLGTGTGRLGPATCAHQVRAALDDILLERYTMPRTWAEASQRHQSLYTDHPRRLQHDPPAPQPDC